MADETRWFSRASATVGGGVSTRPGRTARRLVEEWLAGRGERSGSDKDGPSVEIRLALLDESSVEELARRAGIDTEALGEEGYGMAWISDDVFLICSRTPRGLVYACGYELPRWGKMRESAQAGLPAEARQSAPTDTIRGSRCWTEGGADFVERAARQIRMNTVWFTSNAALEVELPDWPELQGFVDGRAEERAGRRAETRRAVELGLDYGIDVYVGGSWQHWHLPDDLYAAFCRAHPEVVEDLRFEPSSPWPPALWTDRPRLCFCQEKVKRLYRSIIEEFLSLYPEAAGFGTGFGYDGYPFGASCPRCRGFSYPERLREQAELVYDIVVRQAGRKLILWTWTGGPLFAVPGYNYYFDWLPEFVARDPERITTVGFAVTGDFNPPYPLNPIIGTRGPRDCGLILTWHDYRGDSAVPAWLGPWIERSFPRLRKQGAAGFFAMEAWPEKRMNDWAHAAELDAFGRMTWDERLSALEVGRDYCERAFGVEAAEQLAPLLLRTGEVVDRSLFLPSGHRLARHSEIDDHLKRLWDVSVLMDSAPFFLGEEAIERLRQSGEDPLAFLERELAWLMEENAIGEALKWRDGAVQEAEELWEKARVVLADTKDGRLRMLLDRFAWLVDYARLFRGFTRATLRLKQGKAGQGDEIRMGAAEMREALQRLPDEAELARRQIFPYWQAGGPWQLPHVSNFLESLEKAAWLLDETGKRAITIAGDPEGRDFLASLFIPYVDLTLAEQPDGTGRIVLGAEGMREAARNPEPILQAVKNGALVVLHHDGIDLSTPLSWLPGKLTLFPCSLESVVVKEPAHPLCGGASRLSPQPMSVRGRPQPVPLIRAFAEATDPWRALTWPGVLLDCRYGRGSFVMNLLPANRAVFLRCLAQPIDSKI